MGARRIEQVFLRRAPLRDERKRLPSERGDIGEKPDVKRPVPIGDIRAEMAMSGAHEALAKIHRYATARHLGLLALSKLIESKKPRVHTCSLISCIVFGQS